MAQATGLSPAEDEESWDVELRPALDAVPFERTWISDGVAYAAPSQVALDCLCSEREAGAGEELLQWMMANEDAWRTSADNPASAGRRGGETRP